MHKWPTPIYEMPHSEEQGTVNDGWAIGSLAYFNKNELSDDWTAQDPEDAVQFSADAQLDTMGALAMIRFARKFDRLERCSSELSSSSGDQKHMLSVLNWIANFFVREPQGDVVATALSASNDKLNLYIAMNRGKPEQVDRNNGLAFLDALRTALRESDTGTAAYGLILAAFSASTKRVQRKLHRIVNKHPGNTEITVVFEDWVGKWIDGGGKEDTLIWEMHRALFPGIPVTSADAALIIAFRELKSHIGNFGSNELSTEEQLYTLSTLALALCKSQFFETLPQRAPVPQDDILMVAYYPWLMQLRRRLWRVAHYITDAEIFVKHGFRYIKAVLQNNLQSFVNGGENDVKIVWVGDDFTFPVNHGRRYEWPESPDQRLVKLLEDYKLTGATDPFCEAIRTIWTAGHLIRPFLHCELQLIEYLQMKNITVYKNMVGISKLMCFACDAYVTALNARSKREHRWVLSGTSGKAHHAWLIPDMALGGEVALEIQKVLEDRITNLAIHNYNHTRTNSGGSDSSGGSRDSDGDGGISQMLSRADPVKGRFR